MGAALAGRRGRGPAERGLRPSAGGGRDEAAREAGGDGIVRGGGARPARHPALDAVPLGRPRDAALRRRHLVGDINTTFATLEAQVPLGLSTSMSGVPYWGTDIGGFFPAGLTPELYARWFAFGAFCPLFRSHGWVWRQHVPWAHGPAALRTDDQPRDRHTLLVYPRRPAVPGDAGQPAQRHLSHLSCPRLAGTGSRRGRGGRRGVLALRGAVRVGRPAAPPAGRRGLRDPHYGDAAAAPSPVTLRSCALSRAAWRVRWSRSGRLGAERAASA